MKNISRRAFVQTSLLSAASGIFVIPALKSCSPNNKLNIAIVGVGGRGGANTRELPADAEGAKTDNIVAMCDVDDARAAEGFTKFPNAQRFRDFRVMFDRLGKQIDAVVISTPDHTHFPIAMAAMQLGKHVYVEKPLAHNVWQTRTLRKAAGYYNFVTQMGNQGHTTEGIRLVKEWYDAGILGEVTEVLAWNGEPKFDTPRYFMKPESYPPEQQPVPDGLDWELWLGPVADRPFNHVYLPRTWRGWYDFGNGALGDWACHTLDAPFWTLELGMPDTIESVYKKKTYDDLVPEQSELHFTFPARGPKPPVTLKWYEGGLKPEMREEWGLPELKGAGMIMIGDKKSLMTGGAPVNPRLLIPEEEWQAFTKAIPKRTIPRAPDGKPQVEWVDAIKNGTTPGSNFNYAAGLTEVTLLGVLAQRLDTKLLYDASSMRITNQSGLDDYLKEPVRDGWEYGEELW